MHKLFAILLCAWPLTESYPTELTSITLASDTVSQTFHVEIAATPRARARGLMFRQSLPEGTGMLFLYPRAEDHRFWMRNTYIPLDIIFFEDGVFQGAVTQTVPHSLAEISIGKPSNQVLEVPAGTVGRLNITPDWRLVLPQ